MFFRKDQEHPSKLGSTKPGRIADKARSYAPREASLEDNNRW
jgi:hypothetical protein